METWSAGWLALFDGHSLFGWQPTSNANWHVDGKALSVSHGEHGFLQTTTRFANFELQLEYSCPADTNSGVFVRSSAQPRNPREDCYEINIAPADNPFPTGSIVGRQKTNVSTSQSDGTKWRSARVVAHGNKVQVWIDGEATANYEDPAPITRGHIGLQFRGDPIAFRNIRLRPLGMESIFNGQDLTGWDSSQAGESRFFVEDGLLRVLDGRGQLETTQSFGDFVLQLECQTNANELNSGVFFRCIPGDQMMGYESQIQNSMVENDPTNPADCGTGGIFRRQNARRIVAADQSWFGKTIIAEGAHFATWVNGYQVTDWTDEREAHENPRKGRRLKAGTIMIQGHDPTTDLSFRNFRIASYPK